MSGASLDKLCSFYLLTELTGASPKRETRATAAAVPKLDPMGWWPIRALRGRRRGRRVQR